MSIEADLGSHSKAHIAGIACLTTIACGLFAEAFVRGSILADVVMLASYIIATATLYRLFKPVNATVSLVAAFLVGTALLASSLIALLASLLLLDDGHSFQTWSPAQLSEAAYAALRLHSGGYSLTGFFFGGYCLLIGWLVIRSHRLPLVIGLLMMLAGVVFVLHAVLVLVAPAPAWAVPDAVMLVSLLGEGSLALWLTAFGVRRPRHSSQPDPTV